MPSHFRRFLDTLFTIPKPAERHEILYEMPAEFPPLCPVCLDNWLSERVQMTVDIGPAWRAICPHSHVLMMKANPTS
jgi:hypothetical protein